MVRLDRALVARRVHSGIWLAHLGRGRAPALPAPIGLAGALALHAQRRRHRRPAGGPAVLARLAVPGRSTRDPRLPRGSLPQDLALLASDAVTAGRDLSGAARPLRLHR